MYLFINLRVVSRSFVIFALCFSYYNFAKAEVDLGVNSPFGNLPRDAPIEPPKKVDSNFLITSPNVKPIETAEEISTHGLSLNLLANYPINSGGAIGSGLGLQGTPAVSPTLQLGLKYNPIISYWFGQVTFYRYLFADRQQAWNPDFTYSFGYDDWHSDTFSFVYSNYTGNRFSPDLTKGEKRTVFNQGQWSFGYKYMLPRVLEPILLVGDGDQIGCNANLNITPQYTDLRTLSTKYYKKSVAFGCRYARPSGWYANFTIFAYPARLQQQPWDPDFSYGFGYFDPHPGTISIQYNNYSANRFPGHDAVRGDGSPRKGSISISWSTQW